VTRKYQSNVHDIYFVSDTHFGHRAMAEHWRAGKYPRLGEREHWKTEMDVHMIALWNNIVPPAGIVFLIGDFTFRNAGETSDIVRQLNGEIHLIPGNHDKQIKLGWGLIIEPPLLEIDVDEQRIVMCHYALRSWNRMHFGAWQLHGHSHGNLGPAPGKQLDVGVDCEEITPALRPLRYQEVKDYMDARQFVAVDHHTEKA
jgi:calcineurin-like phosphoesterase family protein